MPTIQCSASVRAEPSAVFEVLTDLERAAGRIRAIQRIERLDSGPLRVGSRFRETRVMFGKEATELFEVVELEPGRSYATSCESCGVHFGMRFEFHAQPGGTRVDMRVDTTARTFFAKLMSPLSKLMLKSCVKGFEADIADLRKACEA